MAYATAVALALVVVVGGGWQLRGGQEIDGPASVSIVRPVIAVLPFRNLSDEPDSDYFVDGLTDEIIRNLAVIEGVDVRSRTSSFFFKDKSRNLAEVGEQLRANLVVEGSVMRAGKRLRINAQLVRVAADVPLWSERFDRALEDVFSIQDEISRAIVNKLRLTLGSGQRRYNTNLEAYELYLKARALVDRRGVVNAQQAAELFEQVIARDAAYAPAHAGLANAYAFMSMPNAYVMTGQRAEAEKLAAANRGNPYAEGIIYAILGDKERTFEALERGAISAPHRVGRLLMTPEMAVLRGDPRLAEFRRRFGLPQ